MQLNLRQAIVQRVQEKSTDDLFDVIEGSIGNDEHTLPGLGVLFEIIWQHSNSDMRHQLVDTLHQNLPQGSS